MKTRILLSSIFAFAAFQACAQSASEQLNNISGQSQRATYQTTREGARAGAGAGYDTRSTSNTAAQIGSGRTPSLLRNNDGTNPYSRYEGRAIRTTPPPPLR